MLISHIRKILLILALAMPFYSLAQSEPAANQETSSEQAKSNSSDKKTPSSASENRAQKEKTETAKSEESAQEVGKTPAKNPNPAKSEESAQEAEKNSAQASTAKSESKDEACRDKECVKQKLASAKTSKDKAEIFAAYCESVNDAREREIVCLQTGMLFLNGNEKEGISPDAKRAVNLLAIACNGKNENVFAQSCTLLSRIYDHGVEGLEANIVLADKYLSQGCKLHHVSACNKLANQLNYQGRLQEADRIYRENLSGFIKACERGGYEYCYLLGNIYAKGMGLAKNPEKAVAFYGRACNSKEKASAGYCYAVAEKFSDKELGLEDQAKAEKLYRIACDLGESVACKKLPDANL